MYVYDINNAPVGLVIAVFSDGFSVQRPQSTLRLRQDAIFTVSVSVQLICARERLWLYSVS